MSRAKENAALIYQLDTELRHALEQASKHHYLNVIAGLAKATTLALRLHQRQIQS